MHLLCLGTGFQPELQEQNWSSFGFQGITGGKGLRIKTKKKMK